MPPVRRPRSPNAASTVIAKKAPVVPTGRKARGSGHERKQEIADAAKSLFLSEGIENVSTRLIAERVGISQTALYVYFQNKDAILAHLTDSAFRKLGAVLEEVERVSRDPLDYLRKALPTYIRFGLDHPDEYRIAFMMFNQRGAATASADSLEKSRPGIEVFRGMERQIVDGAKRGLIRNRRRKPEGTAQSIWAGIHGLVAAQLAFPDFAWIDRDALIDIHVQILVSGLEREAKRA